MKVPIWVVKRSGTLNNLIEDVGIDDPVPVPNVNFKTFEMLIPLMREDAWMNAQREKDPLFYVPRRFQPFINQELQGKAMGQVAELFKAANYLDVPFILNGVAAVIADRIPVDAREDILKALQLPATNEGKAETTQLLHKHNFDIIAQMTKDLWPLIAKHLVHRQCGITQEYSIADYIVDHGQPQLIEAFLSTSALDLESKKLTSLLGIDMIQAGSQCQILSLRKNCFFDLALDKQPILHPFQGFGQLERLWLEKNELNNLQPGIFDGLRNLQWLWLSKNQLNNLQPGIFDGLTNLQRLKLANNQLNNLQPGVFHGLANLQELGLQKNQLNNLQPDIFHELTNLQKLRLANNQLNNLQPGVFHGLVNLVVLNLGDNQLNNLQPGIFYGLTNLQALGLNNNQLNNLHPGIFHGLANLGWLELKNNQLNNLQPGIFHGLANLGLLGLGNNQLTEHDKQMIKKTLPNTYIDFD